MKNLVKIYCVLCAKCFARHPQYIGLLLQILYSQWCHVIYRLFTVINVCGMPGIGKSHLVRHAALKLMNRGDVAVIFINVRYAWVGYVYFLMC